MAKPQRSFACQNCGALTQRWQGRCEACGEWNTIVEESAAAGIGAQAALGARKGRVFNLAKLIEPERPAPPRILTGIGELDRVSGGGFVAGSVLLLGGEPGIGKSTLLIQACAALASAGRRVIYISGEEAVDQVRLGRSASVLARARSNSPPKQASRISSRPFPPARALPSSLSTPSRPCGRASSNRRRER